MSFAVPVVAMPPGVDAAAENSSFFIPCAPFVIPRLLAALLIIAPRDSVPV